VRESPTGTTLSIHFTKPIELEPQTYIKNVLYESLVRKIAQHRVSNKHPIKCNHYLFSIPQLSNIF
jgi:hypothetical protein